MIYSDIYTELMESALIGPSDKLRDLICYLNSDHKEEYPLYVKGEVYTMSKNLPEYPLARRVSWPDNTFIFFGVIDEEYSGLCSFVNNKVDYYEPTEGDFKASDWTFDVWSEGDKKMGLSYIEVKKILKSCMNCYAGRDGWEDEHGMLAYLVHENVFFLTDFGVDMGAWKPTLEDIQTKDWYVKRYIL